MKKILFLGLIISSITATSQTISELQQQITILEQQKIVLEEKVDFCDLYNSSDTSETKTFNSNFELKVIECIGNSTDQTVEVIVTIKHLLPHQQLYLSSTIAYGETGDSFKFKNSMFAGSNSKVIYIPTNLLLKGKLTYRNVLPQTEKLKLVNGTISFKNKDGGENNGKGEFEIRNLNINWN